METHMWDLLLKQPFEKIMYIAVIGGIELSIEKKTGWVQAKYWIGETEHTMEPHANITHVVAWAILSKLKAEAERG